MDFILRRGAVKTGGCSFRLSLWVCHWLLICAEVSAQSVDYLPGLARSESYTDTFKVPFVSISMAQNHSGSSSTNHKNDIINNNNNNRYKYSNGWSQTSGRAQSYQLYMRPMYINALVDVIFHYRWDKVIFYYDSDEGLIRLQQLFQATNKYEKVLITIDTKRIGTVDNGYQMLRELHLLDIEADHRVLLDVRIDKAEQIIGLVMDDLSINNAKFHFLLGDLGMLEMNLSRFKIGGVNITGFQLVDSKNQTSKANEFIEKWSKLDPVYWPRAGSRTFNYEAALAVDSVRLFTRAFGKILEEEPDFIRRSRLASLSQSLKCTDDSMVRAGHGEKILEQMKKVEFEGISGHIAFDQNGLRKDFTLDVYNVALTRGTAKIGSWSHKTGRFKQQLPSLLRQGNPSPNRTRIVTTIQKEPYVTIKKKPVQGEPLIAGEHLEGFCIDLTKAVAEKLEFDYQIRFVKDGRYGSPMSNGTWDGMVGELIRHEADMAIAPFTITADRSRVIDFTKPFMSLGISIMIQRPEPSGKHFFSFMEPLSYEIWMCIVFAYIGVSVVLFLVSRFSPNEWHISEPEHYIANDFSISNSLWFSLGAFMQQGCDISPRSMSGRIVGSVWWFFTLIIISSYTANLAAFLTVERMLTPIDSAEDLARQTEIQYGTISSGSTKAFFKNSQFQTYQRMWAYMMSAQPSVFVQKHEDGIARVRHSKGKYAYLTESTTIDYVSSRKPCDTLKVGNNLNSDGFGIGTPVGSDLRELLNFAVLELREDGELGKWQRNWFDKGDCEQYTSNKDGAQSALDLDNVAGIFLILIGGLVTAIISAAAEFLYKSKMDSEKSLTSFGSAVRSKARLSFKGHIDKDREGSTRSRSRSHGSVTYTYQGPTHVVGGNHGFEDANTHTEV
ncbi:hypothetical protein RRG08_020080 [Elysia crispata]|uniref:Glutamate receptor n=1 Tax=Elysia crispata TaxID=231223 RepID=A0AAE1DTK3_9GAST|nr:hypothetical protein RRG08_020080 [Elysia crispata]